MVEVAAAWVRAALLPAALGLCPINRTKTTLYGANNRLIGGIASRPMVVGDGEGTPGIWFARILFKRADNLP